jgi:4-hydroxy-tetrahydrodipicolinate reductase
MATEIRATVAGATGSTGRAVAEGVLAADDLRLTAAVARSSAGSDLGTAWGRDEIGVRVHGDVDAALNEADVLVDFTSHDAVLTNTLSALRRGVRVVIGTSGLTAEDFAVIEDAAREAGLGVVAAGNFSLTAAMMQAAAALVAPHLPGREIVDYASATKPDAPSGTARELAERLAMIGPAAVGIAVDEIAGLREARGATVAGTQVHSVRLPSYSVSTEVIFGLPEERLVIRHEAGASAQPYVAGALLAVRAVGDVDGLVRGLDTLLLAGR